MSRAVIVAELAAASDRAADAVLELDAGFPFRAGQRVAQSFARIRSARLSEDFDAWLRAHAWLRAIAERAA